MRHKAKNLFEFNFVPESADADCRPHHTNNTNDFVINLGGTSHHHIITSSHITHHIITFQAHDHDDNDDRAVVQFTIYSPDCQVDFPGEFDHGWCPSRVLDSRQTSSLANHNNIDKNSTGSITPYFRGPSPIDCGDSHERFLVITIHTHNEISINNSTILNNDDDDDAILE